MAVDEKVGEQIDKVSGTLPKTLVRGLKLHITLLAQLCPKINEYLGINMIIKILIYFQTDERTSLSRRGASLRPACARRSRDHFGTDSVRFKLPPLYVPVSRSPVWRIASRDLWRSIGPSTMVVFMSANFNG